MTPPAPTRSSLATIGQVLGQLRPEFPDVSHSKIRFLEERGLVRPQRTPSGYRKFSPADVERLRFVLGLQRDRYLPLKVIGEYLTALDAGLRPPPLPEGPVRPPARLDAAAAAGPPAGTAADTGAPSGADGAPGPAPGEVGARGWTSSRPPRVTRADLDAAAGGDGWLVDALVDHGLLALDADAAAPVDAAEVVRAARELADHGIEPRHLRPLRAAIEREAALVHQVVSPQRRQRTDPPDPRAAQVEAALVGAVLRLHASLLRVATSAPAD